VTRDASAILHRLDAPLTDAERGARLFRGELIVFRRLPAVTELVAWTDALVREGLGGDDPATRHRGLERESWRTRVASLQTRFRRDPTPARLFAQALVQIGADPGQTFRDRLGLRVVPPGDRLAGGRMSRTHPHRDTWGSNLPQQVNWWLPVYPLAPGRTLAVYPAYWNRPIANSCAEWSFEALIAHRRRHPGALTDGYPTVPHPTEPVDTASELRVRLDPGDLLCFSSAHLHGSVPNDTGRTRFSVETRTVSLPDLRAGGGAPDVDGGGGPPRLEWFRRVTDGAPLAEIVADRADRGRTNLTC